MIDLRIRFCGEVNSLKKLFKNKRGTIICVLSNIMMVLSAPAAIVGKPPPSSDTWRYIAYLSFMVWGAVGAIIMLIRISGGAREADRLEDIETLTFASIYTYPLILLAMLVSCTVWVAKRIRQGWLDWRNPLHAQLAQSSHEVSVLRVRLKVTSTSEVTQQGIRRAIEGCEQQIAQIRDYPKKEAELIAATLRRQEEVKTQELLEATNTRLQAWKELEEDSPLEALDQSTIQNQR